MPVMLPFYLVLQLQGRVKDALKSVQKMTFFFNIARVFSTYIVFKTWTGYLVSHSCQCLSSNLCGSHGEMFASSCLSKWPEPLWRLDCDSAFGFKVVLKCWTKVMTDLHVVHALPQCLKGCVHDLPLASPLLHDAHTLVVQHQLVDLLDALGVALIRLLGGAVVKVAPPHVRRDFVAPHHLFKDIHHVVVVLRVAIDHHDDLDARVRQPLYWHQALPQVVWVLLIRSDAQRQGFVQFDRCL